VFWWGVWFVWVGVRAFGVSRKKFTLDKSPKLVYNI